MITHVLDILGRRSSGILHTESCRQRMEMALAQDPGEQDRLEGVFMRHAATEPFVSKASVQAPGCSVASGSGGAVPPAGTKRPLPESDSARAVEPKEAPPLPAPKRKHESGGEEIEETAKETEVVQMPASMGGQTPSVERQMMMLLEKDREEVMATIVQEVGAKQNPRPVREKPSGLESDRHPRPSLMMCQESS